jgi:hypothetical protein
MATTAPYVHGQNSQKRAGVLLKLVLAVVLGGGLTGGCGVKGPPTPMWPPAPLPMVADLTCQVADGRVTLTWRLPSPLEDKAARQASFIIRRYRTALDQPACENCPRVFTTVETMPYVETADTAFSLNLALEAGYRYAFTVHLQTGNDVGPDADPVQFDYPSDEISVPVEEP